MANPLIVFHAIVGFIGSLLFLLVAVELKRPIKTRDPAYAKIHIASMLGTLAILISWVMGGYYYVTIYGNEVKPAVKSIESWIHDIGMETKEHLFLFLPFLSMFVVSVIRVYARDLENVRKVLMWTSLSIFLISVIIATEGFWITNAANTVLGVAR